MIVDLNPLPATLALKIINMCIDYRIEMEKCKAILDSHNIYPLPELGDNAYCLEIPEKYITYILLKYNYNTVQFSTD